MDNGLACLVSFLLRFNFLFTKAQMMDGQGLSFVVLEFCFV